MAMVRRRQKQRWWVRLLSFRRFVLFLLLLCVLLAFAPALLFRLRSNQRLSRKCSWLRNRPLVCAHGGDTSNAAPNTDRDLQNIYGNDYIRVGDLTFNEIVKLDAGLNFPKEFQNQTMVPTLVKALKHVSNHVKQIIIDAKVGRPGKSLAASILDVVNATGCKNCLVWSKEDSLVKELKKLSPEVPTGYIVMKDEVTGSMTSSTRMKTPEVVGAYYGAVNAEFVRKIHESRKMVIAWTVDDRERMKDMLYDGVDGIVTNQPHLLQELMLEIQRECSEKRFTLNNQK